jgi:hypothetical protein
MERYDGNEDGKDQPHGGGEYVELTGDAHEKYNFDPVYDVSNPEYSHCFGFVETKSTNGITINQLNIEKISGCEALKRENVAEDVLVVYCAKYPFSSTNETYVVGWFMHAEVYRNYMEEQLPYHNKEGEYTQYYNAYAESKNCVLLPVSSRRNQKWRVPRKRKGMSYGFGQSNVWFAQGADNNPKLKEYLDRIIKQIEEYSEENMINTNRN